MTPTGKNDLPGLVANTLERARQLQGLVEQCDWDRFFAEEIGFKKNIVLLEKTLTLLRQKAIPIPEALRSQLTELKALEDRMIPALEHARDETLAELQSADASRRLNDYYGSLDV